jgi:hypothetical protein
VVPINICAEIVDLIDKKICVLEIAKRSQISDDPYQERAPANPAAAAQYYFTQRVVREHREKKEGHIFQARRRIEPHRANCDEQKRQISGPEPP